MKRITDKERINFLEKCESYYFKVFAGAYFNFDMKRSGLRGDIDAAIRNEKIIKRIS